MVKIKASSEFNSLMFNINLTQNYFIKITRFLNAYMNSFRAYDKIARGNLIVFYNHFEVENLYELFKFSKYLSKQ